MLNQILPYFTLYHGPFQSEANNDDSKFIYMEIYTELSTKTGIADHFWLLFGIAKNEIFSKYMKNLIYCVF